MQKPDFKGIRTLVRAIEDTRAALSGIYGERDLQEKEVKSICHKISAEKGKDALFAYSVDELKNAKAGIRVAALENAGFKTLGDLAHASDYDIESIEGIGEKQREAIRDVVTEFANSLSSQVTIKLSADQEAESPYNNELITALARLISSDRVRAEGKEISDTVMAFAEKLEADHFIKNSVHWLFSSRDLKEHTLDVRDEMMDFCNSELFQSALGLADRYHIASNTAENVAMEIVAGFFIISLFCALGAFRMRKTEE